MSKDRNSKAIAILKSENNLKKILTFKQKFKQCSTLKEETLPDGLL